MTANSNTRNEIELNDDELNLVIGGASTPTLVNPTLLAAAGTLSAAQPIHLAPLPPLHVAVPH
jgi:bacteriocin-like protein